MRTTNARQLTGRTKVWLINVLFHNCRSRLLGLVWHTSQIIRPGTPPRIFFLEESWRSGFVSLLCAASSQVDQRLETGFVITITELGASYFLHTL